MRILMTAILLTLATSASATDAPSLTKQQAGRLDKALAGKAAQPPEQCVARDLLNDVEPVGRSILLYRVGPNLVYRNSLVGSCSALGPGSIPIIERIGRDYCAGDLVRTADRNTGMPRGSNCALGPFVAYRAPGN